MVTSAGRLWLHWCLDNDADCSGGYGGRVEVGLMGA